MLITPRVKLDTVLWLFAAFCFLPLRSPLTLAAVPLLLERMLDSKFPNWWVTSFHYNAYLVIILVFAAVDGAARLDRDSARVREYFAARRRRGTEPPDRAATDRGTGTVALACSVAMIAVALALVPRFAFGAALQPSFYHRDARMNAAAAADAAVPAGVTVEATNYLGPQLSGPGHRPAVGRRRDNATVLPLGGRRRDGAGSSPALQAAPSGSGSRC